MSRLGKIKWSDWPSRIYQLMWKQWLIDPLRDAWPMVFLLSAKACRRWGVDAYGPAGYSVVGAVARSSIVAVRREHHNDPSWGRRRNRIGGGGAGITRSKLSNECDRLHGIQGRHIETWRCQAHTAWQERYGSYAKCHSPFGLC